MASPPPTLFSEADGPAYSGAFYNSRQKLVKHVHLCSAASPPPSATQPKNLHPKVLSFVYSASSFGVFHLALLPVCTFPSHGHSWHLAALHPGMGNGIWSLSSASAYFSFPGRPSCDRRADHLGSFPSLIFYYFGLYDLKDWKYIGFQSSLKWINLVSGIPSRGFICSLSALRS